MGRKHQLAENCIATKEQGGGKRYVEELTGRTINELYARLIATGEIQRAAVNKHQTHGTREEVLALLEHAKPVPQYMTQSQADKIQKEIIEQTEKMKNITKKDLYINNLKEKIENLRSENEVNLLKKELEFQTKLGMPQ